LFVVYYGITYALRISLSPFVAATIALGLEAGALMSEVVRSGIQSVARGQWEAGLASGMRSSQVMRCVVWPQSFRVMLPPAVGVYVSTLKASSLASIIGYIELTRAGLLIRDSTRYASSGFSVLCAVALIYIVINYSMSLLGARLERRFGFVH
jgi:polar amino acid transport system permease protein